MATENLKPVRAWDDAFYGWTDGLNLGQKIRKSRKAPIGKSVWTGALVVKAHASDYPGRGTKKDIRGRLSGIARQTTQVMVRITPGKNMSAKAVKKTIFYIGRDGEATLHDQDGNQYKGESAMNDAAWAWQNSGPQMEEVAQHRLAFNMMFSMPEGTDPRALYDAVRATAEEEFAGHQWLMVQHFDEPQVHCHVTVRAEGFNGIRLNPLKADLQRWRERFAHELRERGVAAEATRRASRLHQARVNKPWAATRIEERGGTSNPQPSGSNSERIAKWTKTENQAASYYNRVIAALHRSDDAADRVIAKELDNSLVGRAARQPIERKATNQNIERT